ncbi:hypothetical protein M885DRAFT_449173, partial [Pelagophyceae sp. CCMP2097]
LRPDGVFICALLGAGTLGELQHAFAAAEEERTGGLSAHASPSTRISDCGMLLQGAGFKLITVDIDQYADAFVLFDDLQRMGEQHAPVTSRARNVSRDTFLAMAAAYQASSGMATVKATFEVIYLIGWAPHAAQPKAMARGGAARGFGQLKPGGPPGDGLPPGDDDPPDDGEARHL